MHLPSRRQGLVGFVIGAATLAAWVGWGASTALAAAPVCTDASYTVANNDTLALPITASCSDADGDAMQGVAAPSTPHGSLSPDGSGGAIYHPNPGYVGPDVFTYHATANGEDSNTATVSITVTAGPQPPPGCLLNPPTTQAFEGQDTSVGVPCFQGFPGNTASLSVIVVTPPAHGTVSFPASGITGTYTADDEYVGADSFDAKVSNGTSESPTVTVPLNVVDFPEGNQTPTCPDTNVFVEAGSSIRLRGNCVDPDGDPLTYGPGNPFTVNGSFSDPTGDSVLFTPSPGFTGLAALNYTVRDPYHPTAQFHIPINVLTIGTPCCETAPEATPEEPYAASITSPVPGGIYIDTRPTSLPAPTGFTVLNQEYDISAPEAIDPDDPLVFVFKLDGAELAAQNVAPASARMLRNGTPVNTACPPLGQRTDPNWWPCEQSRSDHDGDLWITVLTMHGSIWNVGVPAIPDSDSDGVGDDTDNCVSAANPDQVDADRDGIGAACDTKEVPTSKDDCKNNGWKAFDGVYTFKNQGDCVSFVATGGKNTPAGRRKHHHRHDH